VPRNSSCQPKNFPLAFVDCVSLLDSDCAYNCKRHMTENEIFTNPHSNHTFCRLAGTGIVEIDILKSIVLCNYSSLIEICHSSSKP